MSTIDHLSVSASNFIQCVYSLAARDYNKALGWINSAIAHIKIYAQDNKPSNMSAVYKRMREYEKIKTAIESGGRNTIVELINKVNEADEDDDEYEEVDEPTVTKSARAAKVRSKLTFADVVGLEHVKEAVRGAIVYPFRYKDVYRAFKRGNGGGILLYGAPGTGKTMVARAIAGEIDADFTAVNCSDIYSKWLGESQRNVKKLFDRARRAERAVLFFDEFEALGGERNNDGNSGGTNAVVCELLAQIDGFCSDANSTVLLIAATNRPWDIDSALLRSGRFERHLYVGMPGEDERIEIVRKQMDGLPVDALCYEEIGRRTEGFSSADVAQACDLVKDRAIMRSINGDGISNITQWDFTDVLSDMRPTVDPNELKRLEYFA